MNLQIIAVPYDSGHRGERMGAGPAHFVERGVERMLREAGHHVEVETLDARTRFLTEIGTAFDLHRQLAERVRTVTGGGRLPLVLAGNCGGASLGALAGLSGEPLGIVWFDAHGDFNTPETTTSGFLDGMPLAIATGRCWTALAATIPGWTPVPEAYAIHVGGRDLDTEEASMMAESAMTVIPPQVIRDEGICEVLMPALDVLAEYVRRVYVHIDLDALDPTVAPANELSVPGGLSLTQIEESIQCIGERFEIGAVGFASYDPAVDPEDRMIGAGFHLMRAVVAAAAR